MMAKPKKTKEKVEAKEDFASKFIPYVFSLHANHEGCDCAPCRAFHDHKMQEAIERFKVSVEAVLRNYGIPTGN